MTRSPLATALALLLCAAGTSSAADLITPLAQERYVELSLFIELGGNQTFTPMEVLAPDFGPFDDNLDFTENLGGSFAMGSAAQTSVIAGDVISVSGATLADASAAGGYADATAESKLDIDFNLAQEVQYFITTESSGWLLIILRDPLGNIVFESINMQGVTTSYNAEGILAPGDYNIVFRHYSTAYSDAEYGGSFDSQGTFTAEFRVQNVTVGSARTSFGRLKALFD